MPDDSQRARGDFIELDRTFRDLAISDEDGDEAKMVRLFAREASTRWADILREGDL